MIYIPETDSIVYLDPIVTEFEKQIAALDYMYGHIQTVSFSQQGLVFEADIHKGDDNVRICHLYAMTTDLEALTELENQLKLLLDDRLQLASVIDCEHISQQKQISQDRLLQA